MRIRVAAGVLLAVTTVLTACFVRGPVVIVSSDDGQLDECWPASRGDVITLVFTNSMYGGEVRESFRVDDGTLVRVAFETENAAAAEYYAYDRPVEPISGGYRVTLPDARFESVPIRVDARGMYRLRIGGDEISLSDDVEGTSATQLAAGSRSIIGRLGCR